MADVGIPHFHNDPGVPAIHLGSREFMCIGATPPFDHPHVFLDMGSDDEIVCPYCSTLYTAWDPARAGRFSPRHASGQIRKARDGRGTRRRGI
jgi:uncharacterized Zn-finger protein